MSLIIKDIDIPQLGRKRTLRVLLPPSYETEGNRRYPVLYMQDGHNLFDPATSGYGVHWRVAESLEELYKKKAIPEIIVAGIDCNTEGFKRLDEYSPWINYEAPEQLTRFFNNPVDSVGGEGEAYAAFLADSLKPYMDSSYRTRPGRESCYLAGSSMGGLISLYAAYRRPDLYSCVGAFSTAIWFAREGLLDHIKTHFNPDISIYLDIGTKETSDEGIKDFPDIYLKQTLELSEFLLSLGLLPWRHKLVVDEGAPHNEASWARRFPGFITWIPELKTIPEATPI